MSKTIMERVDEHTHVPQERLVLRPPFPDSIKIEITSRCNYNCSYCAAKRQLRPQGDINKEFLFRILREAALIGVKEIGMFLLGESLLVRELPEYVKFAKEEAGIEYVFLTTNGSLATPEVIVPLIEAGLDSIKFSINAGTQERYQEMHGVDAFNKVLENIRWLHEYRICHHRERPRTCVSSIRIEGFQEEMEAFHHMIAAYVDDYYQLPLYNQAGHIDGREYNRIVGNSGRFENMVPPVPCWALFNAAKITWNGRLTACCFDHDTRFEITDLNHTSLLEAWHHPKFINMREQHLSGKNAVLSASNCSKCLDIPEDEKL